MKDNAHEKITYDKLKGINRAKPKPISIPRIK